jgi:hypothetical protein
MQENVHGELEFPHSHRAADLHGVPLAGVEVIGGIFKAGVGVGALA